MHRARPLESTHGLQGDREAGRPASRSTPLTLVSGAVAGDDLARVARSAADALECPVAIALPAIAQPVASPASEVATELVEKILEHARAVMRGEQPGAPEPIADAVPIRIGEEIVGVVAAIRTASDPPAIERRAWLEAAAAAAAVTLMRDAQDATSEDSRRAFLQALWAGPPADVEAFAAQARRLGFELAPGAIAICARGRVPDTTAGDALLADLGDDRNLGLLPLDREDGAAEQLAQQLRSAGLEVALSAPRKDPAALHDALREAELLVELASCTEGQENTYRLLIGVLLRDPEELEALRESTISALTEYDARHDTDLLATLQTFLAHHGSTTETADAMNLHRHTVGYRLSRVHEVSRLSPYESEGRERLSLGLKADQILAAHQRLTKPG